MRTALLLTASAVLALAVGTTWVVGSDRDGSAPRPSVVRWVAVASGTNPASTQVSLEQDLAAVRDHLGDGGVLLFAAGSGAPVVQWRTEARAADPVRDALASLFMPRDGRDAEYRAPMLEVHGPATWATLERELSAQDTSPLLLWLGGHGERGETPADSTVTLWGEPGVGARDLAEVLDRGTRPVRVVATTCFSGGLASIVHRGGDTTAEPSDPLRCGVFATTWDQEAEGCDPEPARTRQESYALHFLPALRGQQRDGSALPPDLRDLDGDGATGLLEAHTWARIAAPTADNPTTSAEAWLRSRTEALPPAPGARAVDVPEEDAVVRHLGQRLGLAGDHDGSAARERLTAGREILASAMAAVDAAAEAEEVAYLTLSAELLARWPVLDDPWHPAWNEVYAAAARELAREEAGVGMDSPAWRTWEAARAAVDEATRAEWALRRELAPVERLVRAQETIELANRLARAGGPDFATWAALRTCERAPP